MDEGFVRMVRDQVADKNRRGQTLDEVVKELSVYLPAPIVAEARRRYEAEIQEIHNLKDPKVIVDPTRVGWYAGPQPGDLFWPPLASMLQKKLGEGFDALNRASTRIVSLLGCPQDEAFTTKGLVLGYVQSGKTGNFTAVVAKAADAGYRFVLVLSGLHNSLRRQTQLRIQKDLVHHTKSRWLALTEPEVDFKYKDGQSKDNPNSYLHGGADKRLLCVIKKNVAPLRAIRRWFKAADPTLMAQCPVLIIDDEADQASLDASPKGQAKRTAINALILDLLKLLPKAAWVGYTATPYANVLVDTSEEDLYPRDFIVDLDRPAAYFGAERLFGRDVLDEGEEVDDGLQLIRSVSTNEAAGVKPTSRDQRDAFEPNVDHTPALTEALRWFVLACGARLVRGQGHEHMTMLVHTTLYTDAHREVGYLLEQLVSELRGNLHEPSGLNALKGLWEKETTLFPASVLGETAIAWEAVEAALPAVLGKDPVDPKRDRIQIVIDNNKSTFRLNYPEEGGSMQIVVGGNTLSRGLTLEGLMVSYYVRATNMYDTLMQMGRWFGYRPGYGDLTRIWMTDDLRDHFRHLALVEAEIRRDIRRYEDEGRTPKEFGPAIRTHSTLAITSPLKMKHAVDVRVSYSGAVKQTIFFHRDRDIQANNLAVTRALLAGAHQIAPPTEVWGTHQLYRDVPVQLIREFLTDFRIHELSRDLKTDLLLGFITDQIRGRSLLHWNVGVVGTSKGKSKGIDLIPGKQVPLLNRTALEDSRGNLAYLKAIFTVSELAIDLGWDSRQAPPDTIKSSKSQEELMLWRSPISWQKTFERPHPQPQAPGVGSPLLLIYPIDKDSDPKRDAPPAPGRPARLPLGTDEHLIGLMLAFPVLSQSTPQKYVTADLGIDAQAETYVDPEDEEDEG
jgi:hypothetical protein